MKGIPSDQEEAVNRLLAEFRHRPRQLRDEVRELLRTKKFETQAQGARETTYWVSFWDTSWEAKAAALGIEEQGWWFEFTRQGVTVKLGGGQVSDGKRRIVDGIMRLLDESRWKGRIEAGSHWNSTGVIRTSIGATLCPKPTSSATHRWK